MNAHEAFELLMTQQLKEWRRREEEDIQLMLKKLEEHENDLRQGYPSRWHVPRSPRRISE